MSQAIRSAALKPEKNTLSIVIALTQPKVSEAWMSRMTEYLSPSVVFVSVISSSSHYDMPSRCVGLVEPIKGIPDRLLLFLKRRTILKKLEELLDSYSRAYEIKILCHYMTNATYLWSVLALYNKQLFIHVHGHDVTWERKWEKYPFIPAHGFFYKNKARVCGNKSIVIANSKSTIQKLKCNKISESSIRLKYLGVPDIKINKDILNLDVPKIVYLGRLVDYKGPLETVQAFRKVIDNNISAELHFIGDGESRKKLKEYVRDNGLDKCVFIHGALPYHEAMNHLVNAYLFTAHNKVSKRTGQEEAFGVSVVEAMMLGVPVVTGRSGGVVETVQHEKTGILFEPGDIDAHAECIYHLIKKPDYRNKLASNARALAKLNFSLKAERDSLKKIMGL
jgi:glycosyltransferase involved in cell wall biosynthesis